MLDSSRKTEALALLAAAYPNAKPALEFRSPFELLVATILSAQCTDVMVNRCTRALFPVANTPAQFAAMTEEELYPYIKSCGFYRMKGQHILETSRILVTQYGGEVPADLEKLQSLPGVGRKTANVVGSNAFGIPAIAVDTHVFRVSNRIGLAHASNVEKTEAQLQKAIPKQDWSKAHHWLIYHGRQVCSSQKPKCEICTLSHLCEYYQTGLNAATKPTMDQDTLRKPKKKD
ncbi:MAG: endonuclease III [Eubacteriales bacterium]|nr:endonuclease III [Eubacteriales bacterium]